MEDILDRFFEIGENPFISKENIIEILKSLKKYDKNKLCSSPFHGLHHSQKVFLFAYLLGKKEGLNEVDMQIIKDAAFYHDMGRTNDQADDFHGYAGVVKIEAKNLFKDGIYAEEENLIYLKAVIEAHSLPKKSIEKILDNYQYQYPNTKLDIERFRNLYNILLDADALDRTRFSLMSPVYLQERYLRIESSKEMVPFAQTVNNFYTTVIDKINYDKYAKSVTGMPKSYDCFHGIGFDFLTLDSILKYGILSEHAAIEKGLILDRGYLGKNNHSWISVVDANSIPKNEQAYQDFIQQGISFYCFVPQLVQGEDKNSTSQDTSAPLCTDEYTDQKFVFSQIGLDQIHSIIIPQSLKNKKVTELNYLQCSSHYEKVFRKVFRFKEGIEEEVRVALNARNEENTNKLELDDTNVINLLAEYHNANNIYTNMLEVDQERLRMEQAEKLKKYKCELNKEIQKWVDQGFKIILNKKENEEIFALDIVLYFLQKNNMDVKRDNIFNEEEIIIINSEYNDSKKKA